MRGWTLDVLNVVRTLRKSEFTLADVYAFERSLARLHLNNANIQPKIRQQLQVLRDHAFLPFSATARIVFSEMSSVARQGLPQRVRDRFPIQVCRSASARCELKPERSHFAAGGATDQWASRNCQRLLCCSTTPVK